MSRSGKCTCTRTHIHEHILFLFLSLSFPFLLFCLPFYLTVKKRPKSLHFKALSLKMLPLVPDYIFLTVEYGTKYERDYCSFSISTSDWSSISASFFSNYLPWLVEKISGYAGDHMLSRNWTNNDKLKYFYQKLRRVSLFTIKLDGYSYFSVQSKKQKTM